MEETTTAQSKKRIYLPIIIILVLIVGVLMTIKASVHKEASLNSKPMEMVEGAEIRNFQLTNLDGSKINIADLSHKVMLINFWATWCEACMEEIPSMIALRNKYNAQGFEILAVNVDENPNQAVPPIAKLLKIPFPIFSDPGNVVSEIFDVHAIPFSVMISKDRKILMIEPGGRDWDDEETNLMLQKWLKD